MDYTKTNAHFTRAVMEGVAYSLRHNLEAAQKAGAEADTLYVMGGSANSRLWTQIKADVTGRRMEVPSSDTATALGAAILAGVGTNVYSGFDDAVKRTVRITRVHEPDANNREAYDKGYRVYRKLYENLKSLMSEVRQ
jgi:xylulokinase